MAVSSTTNSNTPDLFRESVRRSEWSQAWRRFSANRMALVGLAIIGLLILLAIFAPYIAPYDPIEDIFRGMRGGAPTAEHPFGYDHLGRDLLTRVIAEGKDPASTAVGTVATRPVASVALDAPLRKCAEILRDRGVRHLPVVDGEKPVGILSARDFFDAVAGGLERVIEHARYDEALRENADPYDHLGGGYGR